MRKHSGRTGVTRHVPHSTAYSAYFNANGRASFCPIHKKGKHLCVHGVWELASSTSLLVWCQSKLFVCFVRKPIDYAMPIHYGIVKYMFICKHFRSTNWLYTPYVRSFNCRSLAGCCASRVCEDPFHNSPSSSSHKHLIYIFLNLNHTPPPTSDGRRRRCACGWV